MEGYSSEQQQIEALKDWWRKNGKSVLTGVLLGVALIVGWRMWSSNQDSRTAAAAAAYEQMLNDLSGNNAAAAKQRAEHIIKEYENTAYGSLAALTLAKIAWEQGDQATALKQLEWAAQHADDPGLTEIAELRLARVLLDQNKPNDALKALEGEGGAGFKAEREELKGDAYLLAQQANKAVAAYRAALAAIRDDQGEAAARRERLRMKLDDLGAGEQR